MKEIMFDGLVLNEAQVINMIRNGIKFESECNSLRSSLAEKDARIAELDAQMRAWAIERESTNRRYEKEKSRAEAAEKERDELRSEFDQTLQSAGEMARELSAVKGALVKIAARECSRLVLNKGKKCRENEEAWKAFSSDPCGSCLAREALGESPAAPGEVRDDIEDMPLNPKGDQ